MNRSLRWLTIILAVATIIRLPAINQWLWYDEAYTAMLAGMSVPEMLEATSHDVHPPTWYLIEMPFVHLLGMNEAALRLPSVILGVLAVWLTWRLARSFVLENQALLAAGLTAISPFAIYYSNEARMYALLTVAVLLAWIGAIERRRWLLACGTALVLLSHNIGVIYLPLVALLVVQHKEWRYLGTMAMGGLPWLVWAPNLLHQMTSGQVGDGYWISRFTGNQFAKTLVDLTGLLFPHFTPSWLMHIGALIAFCLVLFPTIHAIRQPNWAVILLAALAFGPAVVLLAIGLIWQPMSLARLLAGSLPPWVILIAWWILLPRKWDVPRVALIGLAAGCLMVTSATYYTYDRSNGVRQVIAWLETNVGKDELICHTGESNLQLWSFYYHGPMAPLTDDIAPRCVWLVDERSVVSPQRTLQLIDRVIRERRAQYSHNLIDNPAIHVDLWKLQ